MPTNTEPYDGPGGQSMSNNQYFPFEPQTHYQRPWPSQFRTAWEVLCIVLPIAMLVELFVPGGMKAFVPTYIFFAIVGPIGLLLFFLADPSTGTLKTVHLRRLPDDGGDGSSRVEVIRIRPLFGLKKCEMLGGRESSKYVDGGVTDYDAAYIVYRWRSLVGRIRWERAGFVVGAGEAMDCTADVGTRDGEPVTRLQWQRQRTG